MLVAANSGCWPWPGALAVPACALVAKAALLFVRVRSASINRRITARAAMGTVDVLVAMCTAGVLLGIANSTCVPAPQLTAAVVVNSIVVVWVAFEASFVVARAHCRGVDVPVPVAAPSRDRAVTV
jgi:hypothetical protein